jgi:hypothetical protein
MVATVGSISVDLAVKSAAFEAGFKKAGATVERESNRMAAATKRAQGVIGGLFTGIATGAALAGVASLSGALAKAGKALRDFDDIADTSRTLGLTTKAFQTLGFAALEAGVSQEKLNSSLGIFAKNVGLAKTGQGALVAGLKELNPELLQNIINADSQAERLDLVADAMARAGSATERAALATTIFGKGGLEMVRILDKGAAGLDDFAKRAEAAGFIIDEKLLQSAGAAADKLDIMTKIVDLNLSAALANLSPVLIASAEGFVKFSKDISDTAAAINAFVANPSLQTLKDFFNSPGGLQLNIEKGGIADSVIQSFKRGADTIKAEIASVEEAMLAASANAAALGFEDVDVSHFTSELQRLREELASVERVAAAAGANGGDALKELVESADRAVAEVDQVGAAIDGLRDKTVTITVRTVQTADGPIGVTSLGGVAQSPLQNPLGSGSRLDPLGNYDTFAAGGYTGNAPSDRVAGVVHGGEFVFDADSTAKIGADNLEAIRRGVRGYETGGAVGTVATLTGGADVLSMIEDNTYQGLMEVRRIIPYLDTLVTDEQATLAAIRDLQGTVSSLGSSLSSIGSMSSGGFSSGTSGSSGGGYSSGSSMDNPYRYVGGVFYPGSGGFDWRSYNAWQGGFQQQRTGLDGFADGGIAYEPSIFGEAGPEAAVPLISGKIPVEIKGGGGSTMHVHYHAAPGNPDPSPRAMMEMQDRVRQTLRANPL